jgi:hypothetical protein
MARNPEIIEISRTSNWALVVGAIFGALTLAGLFYFVLQAASQPTFICASFQLVAGAFALGAALSSAFIGGGAVWQANQQVGKYSLYVAAGGGVAVLFGAFFLFSSFQPKSCDLPQNALAAAQARLTEAYEKARALEVSLSAIKLNTADAQRYAKGSEDNSSDAATCSDHARTILGLLAELSDNLSDANTQVALLLAIVD